jgi:hypothetical protein
MIKTPLPGLIWWICCLANPVAANVVETFSHGSNDGDWQLTTNPIRTLTIEPSGGDPGPYLRGAVESAVPTWYVPAGTSTDFLGDYYAKGVLAVSADINIFVGNHEPHRTLTLDLRSTLGIGNGNDQVEAYYIGPNISHAGQGWVAYQFPLNARAKHIPAGWTVLGADGQPGTFQDWQNLMHDVESIGFELGQPGFAYTNHTVWDLGLDNPRLKTAESVAGIGVPEPGPLSDIGIAAALTLLFVWRKHRTTAATHRTGASTASRS